MGRWGRKRKEVSGGGVWEGVCESGSGVCGGGSGVREDSDGTTHVDVHCTPTSSEHPEPIRHSSRVSSLRIHNICGSC